MSQALPVWTTTMKEPDKARWSCKSILFAVTSVSFMVLVIFNLKYSDMLRATIKISSALPVCIECHPMWSEKPTNASQTHGATSTASSVNSPDQGSVEATAEKHTLKKSLLVKSSNQKPAEATATKDAFKTSLLVSSSRPTHVAATAKRHSFEKYLLANFPGRHNCQTPKDNSDLPPHVIKTPAFRCGQGNPQALEKHTNKTRLQLLISCHGGKVKGRQRRVKFDTPLQEFRTEKQKECLKQYIALRCYDNRVVPDVIHFLWYGKPEVSFTFLLSLYSVLTVATPRLVVLHSDVRLRGALWRSVLPHATSMVRVHKAPQTHTQAGSAITHVQNRADIGRIEILLDYGGIYLDTDMVVTRKLDIFRDVQFAANKEGSDWNLTNAILISVAGQQLLKIWHDLWKSSYGGTSWGSHSTHLITKLSKKYPHLMSPLGPIFHKFGYPDTRQLYMQTCSLQESFAAHLYKLNYPKGIDLRTIQTHRSTFGRIARFVLFGTPDICP